MRNEKKERKQIENEEYKGKMQHIKGGNLHFFISRTLLKFIIIKVMFFHSWNVIKYLTQKFLLFDVISIHIPQRKIIENKMKFQK